MQDRNCGQFIVLCLSAGDYRRGPVIVRYRRLGGLDSSCAAGAPVSRLSAYTWCAECWPKNNRTTDVGLDSADIADA